MTLLEHIGVSLPIIQAPMAGVSTPEMAAAVSNAGALGSIGVGATDAAGARAMIEEMRQRTAKPFNVNLFVHRPTPRDPQREGPWLAALAPIFRQFNSEPPTALRPIYKSFIEDDDMFAVLLELKPAVVSFHFGLPDAGKVAALKSAGCTLIATATSLAEALAAKAAGMDAIVAQGWEAGGHRGVFDPEATDDRLGTMALTRLLVLRAGLPVVAAGGIMDGQGIRAALDFGRYRSSDGNRLCPLPRKQRRFGLSGCAGRASCGTYVDDGCDIGPTCPQLAQPLYRLGRAGDPSSSRLSHDL